MAARGIHHVDLAVADVDASLAFYLDLLRPLGLAEEVRYPTYRGTEEVVYLVDAHHRRRTQGYLTRPWTETAKRFLEANPVCSDCGV